MQPTVCFSGFLTSADRGLDHHEGLPEREANYDRHSAAKTHRLEAPLTFTDGGYVLGLSGRPHFHGQVVDATETLGHVLEAYRKGRRQMLAALEGPFALAILAVAENHAVLAVDRMGIERITYAVRPDGLFFGRRAGTVARFPSVGARLREQALYDFLFMHMVPAPGTVYEGVSKLPPATCLIYDGSHARTERYWLPEYGTANQPPSFEELKHGLHGGLANAVKRSGIDNQTGAFLSGGLDSSSITGMLSNEFGDPAKTFTVGFGETGYDELQYARIANSHFECEAFEYMMAPGDIVEAFPRIAETYDEPFGNSSAAPTYFCAKLAADNGVTHLLAGDGGDELFGGNERYLRHRVFEAYYKLPEALRRTAIEPLARLFSAESRIMPLRKFRSYVDQALIPLPDRFESWNYVYREGGTRMLDREFSKRTDKDGPMKIMRDVWNASPSDDLLETMLWYDWHFALADNDLRKVGSMCELAGVRVSYPLLDPAVVELSVSVPARMKIQGVELRTFFKRAMRDLLPPEILRKKKHGFGLPFGLWLKTDPTLADMIYSYLSDLKARRIIAADFIDELIAQHRTGHDSYYGYAIWDFAMLEAWLAQHG